MSCFGLWSVKTNFGQIIWGVKFETLPGMLDLVESTVPTEPRWRSEQ